MPILSFPNLDSLRLALATAVISPEVAQSTIRYEITDEGRVLVQPSLPVPKSLATALAKLDVKILARANVVPQIKAPCWPAMLPLQRGESQPGKVLFDLPSEELSRFIAHNARLSTSKPQCNINGRRAFVCLESPPYASLLRASDSSYRAYCEQSPNVWVEFGFRHVLPNVSAPPSRVALVRAPSEWELLPNLTFDFAKPPIELSAMPVQFEDIKARPVVHVTPRLVPAADTGEAELWVLKSDGQDRLHNWLRQADDRLVNRLMAARVTIAGQTAIVLTGRPGAASAPVVVFEEVGYRSYLKVPNLFVPVGQTLRPALRRDAARRRYAPDAGQIVVLDSDSKGINATSIPRSALRLLIECVKYVVPSSLQLEAMSPKVMFATEHFSVSGPATAPRKIAVAKATKSQNEILEPARIRWHDGAWQVKSGAESGHRRREAADSLLQLLWSQSPLEVATALAWMQAEAVAVGPLGTPDDLKEWLNTDADPATTRAMAAFVVHESLLPTPATFLSRNLGTIHERFVTHSEWLPIQAAWLAEVALVRLGCDSPRELLASAKRLLARQPNTDVVERIRADIAAALESSP